MKVNFSIISLLLLVPLISFSQKFGELSKEDAQNLAIQAQRKIELMGENFNEIAALTTSKIPDTREIQKRRIANVLEMFVDSAKVQIKNGGKITRIDPISTYVNQTVANYGNKFQLVHFEMVNFKLHELKKVPGRRGLYAFTYTYTQQFNFVRKGQQTRDKEGLINWVYTEPTPKRGTIFIKKKQTVLGSKWILLFGDIDVE